MTSKEYEIFQVFPKKPGLFTRFLTKSTIIQEICFSCEKFFLLTPNGQVFNLIDGSSTRLQFPVPIRKISASRETVLFMPDKGLYYIGFDLLQNEFAYAPKMIDSLAQVKLKDVHVGLTHAAAIDKLGNLYVWGGAYGPPQLVSKVFTCSKVRCGDFITCVATSGGYFYTYGWFSALDTSLNPYSFQELEKYFVVDFSIGQNFCVVVSDEGALITFDSGHNLLPLRTVAGFHSIHSISNGIFVYAAGNIYKWVGVSLKEWQFEALAVRGGFRIIGESKSCLVVQGELEWELRSEIGNSESLEKIMSPKSISMEKRVYSQYFPQDNTYNKLLEYRKQHKVTGQVVQFIKPFCIPVLRFAWDKIRRFSQHSCLLSQTRVLAELPVLIVKVSQKIIYLNTNFAFEKIELWTRAQIRKEIEVKYIKNSQAFNRREKFVECFKRLQVKLRLGFADLLISLLKICEVNMKKRENAAKKILSLFKKTDRSVVSLKFYKWLLIYGQSTDMQKGFLVLNKLFTKKLGGHALRLVKSYHYYRKFQLNKLKLALSLLSKRSYIQSTITSFNKWCLIGIHSSLRKQKSFSLYRSLAKNIYSVIHHKYKSTTKSAFNSIFTYSTSQKLKKLYRHPILYFSTVVSKVHIRQKFSTFSIISRLREKNSFTMNLDSSNRLSTLCFVIEKIYSDQLKFTFEVLENYNKSNEMRTYEENHDQTLTFFNQPVTEYQNPFILNQTVPKLQLTHMENLKKPPSSSRNSKKFFKVPPKPPSRSGSGSFSGNVNREDSLSRRKNYDNLIRKKIRNEKTGHKETGKSMERILVKKPPKHKFIESKEEKRESPKHNEEFFKISLAVLGLRKFIEKNEFTLMLATFKILKTCFKYSKNPYSRCFRYSPDKSNIFN